MSEYSLQITLLSDTTFGRGDGVAGLIDAEVEHDEFGLPFLRGRALKGLLAEECTNVLFALEKLKDKGDITSKVYTDITESANKLFGTGGSSLENDAEMNISNAVLKDLREVIRFAIQDSRNNLNPGEVLKSLTTIRRQTAMTEKGSPREGSLRSMRVVLRNTVFMADLYFSSSHDEKMLGLLAASTMALQRVGLGRNRGRGKVSVKLFEDSNDRTFSYLERFESLLNQTEAQ